MRVIEAHGPVVDALKAYDPGLRVRWSFEKRKWVVEAKVKRSDGLVPPVFYEKQLDGSYLERILPVLSDRYISYHGGYYVVCWTKALDRRVVRAIWARDSHRMLGGAAAQFDRNQSATEALKDKERRSRSSERAYAAFDIVKHHVRTKPWLEDGTGVSLRGMQ